MKIQVKNLLQGWSNVFLENFNLLSEDLKIKSETKLAICEQCSVRSGLVCSSLIEDESIIDFNYEGEQRFKGHKYKGCSCPIYAKSLSDSQCPLGKFENLKYEKNN